MSTVEYAAEIREGKPCVVKYRIRKCNEWVAHRIPVKIREVIRTEQNRWKFSDSNEFLPKELAASMNRITK